MNDVLVTALFCAIGAWNDKLQGQPGLACRIAVPINLRRSPDEPTPAINAVSMVFLDRMQGRDAPDSLLKSVHAELNDIKRWGTAWAMVQALRLAGTLPRGIVCLVPQDRCLTTTVLSNYGIVPPRLARRESIGAGAPGQITLERIEPFAPIRAHTRAALSAITYADQLTLTITHDPRWLTLEDAQQLLQAVVVQAGQLMRPMP